MPPFSIDSKARRTGRSGPAGPDSGGEPPARLAADRARLVVALDGSEADQSRAHHKRCSDWSASRVAIEGLRIGW